MNQEMQQKLHKALARFIHENGLNPTTISISATYTKALIVLDILPQPQADDPVTTAASPKPIDFNEHRKNAKGNLND